MMWTKGVGCWDVEVLKKRTERKADKRLSLTWSLQLQLKKIIENLRGGCCQIADLKPD